MLLGGVGLMERPLVAGGVDRARCEVRVVSEIDPDRAQGESHKCILGTQHVDRPFTDSGERGLRTL
jgi:hypothetical protein